MLECAKSLDYLMGFRAASQPVSLSNYIAFYVRVIQPTCLLVSEERRVRDRIGKAYSKNERAKGIHGEHLCGI